jgi:tRNA nucleotidyltransferase/poly(A) polymerase
VMMTPPFSAVDFIQIMGRGHRLSTKSRTETVLVGTDTYVDQWNRGIIANKLTVLGASVKGDYEALSIGDLETVENMNPQDAAKFLEAKRKQVKGAQSVPFSGVPPFDMKSHAAVETVEKAIDWIKRVIFGRIVELEKARGKKDPVGTERGGRRKGLDEKWRKIKVINHRYLTLNELKAYALKENVEAFVDDWIDPEYWVAAKEEWLSKPFDKRFPIVVAPGGFILDGNHRYRVFKAAGRLNEVSIVQVTRAQWEKLTRRFPSSSTMNYGVEDEDDAKFYRELKKQGEWLAKARGVKEPIGTIKRHADGTMRKKIDEGKWRPLSKQDLASYVSSQSKDSTKPPAQVKNTRPGELTALTKEELSALQKLTTIKGRIYSGQPVKMVHSHDRSYDNKPGTFMAMGKGGFALIRFPDGHVSECPFRNLEVIGETKARSVYDGLDPLNVRRMPNNMRDVVDKFMAQKIGKTKLTLTDVANKFAERGFTLSLVGGSIRDLLQGKDPGDLDFVVDCSDNEIKHAIGELNQDWMLGATTNSVIGLVSFEGIDITPNHLHLDTKELSGEFKGGTYKQDAECRDFTVNSMHVDCRRGYLVDSTGRGLEDLKTKTLSIPNEKSFKNNQVLRYFKFVARGYQATDETKKVVAGRFEKAVENQSDARLKGFFIRQIAAKDGLKGLESVKTLMKQVFWNPRLEVAWNIGKTSAGHVMKKAIEFINLVLLYKARGKKVPVGTIHNGRVKLGEGKWRPVKRQGGGVGPSTPPAIAQVATYPTLRKYAVMSLSEMVKYAREEHNVDLVNVTQESRSAWHAVLYQLDLLAEMGIRNRTTLHVRLLEIAHLQDGHSVSATGEKVLAAYNPSTRTILLSHKYKSSFVHEFMHHIYEHLGRTKKDAQRKFIQVAKQTDAYKDFLLMDADLVKKFDASPTGKFWKQINLQPDKEFYYTKPTEMAAYYGSEYIYHKWLNLVLDKKIADEVNMGHGGGVGHYAYQDMKLLEPYFERMMFVKLRKAIEELLIKAAMYRHKHEIVDEQGKHYVYNEGRKKFEYVKKGRARSYPFLMTRQQAEWWASKSDVKQTLLHVTEDANVGDIAEHGFSLKKRAWGRLWGDGVYVCAPTIPSEQMRALKTWAVLYDNPVALKLKIDVRKVLDVDTERAIQSVYQTSAGEEAFSNESEYIANLAGAVEEYRAEVQRLDHLVQRALSEKPDEEGIKPTERIIIEETGVESILDVDPRAHVLAKVLKARGYDALHIRSPEFKIGTGGAQYVVLNPKSIRIFGKVKLEVDA